MRIGDLAKQAGVNIQTVRFYEREQDLRRLVMKEIREFAALHDSLQTSSPSDRKALLCAPIWWT